MRLILAIVILTLLVAWLVVVFKRVAPPALVDVLERARFRDWASLAALGVAVATLLTL